MRDFLSALILIFVAEMGDKTQLLAFALSTQYQYRTVLLGVFLGAFLNHGLAILFAYIISKFSSIQYLQMVSAILFIMFGLVSLNAKKKTAEESECYRPTNLGIIVAIAMCFFRWRIRGQNTVDCNDIRFAHDSSYVYVIGKQHRNGICQFSWNFGRKNFFFTD